MQHGCTDWYHICGMGQENGCCLLCDDAEEGCLCYDCKCSDCLWYSGYTHYRGKGSCDLAEEWKEEAEEKRRNWEDWVDTIIEMRTTTLENRTKGKIPNIIIEQKILDLLKFEKDSSEIIIKLQKIGFLIDDIFIAFDSLELKKKIREKINFATFNYKGKIGFYEVVKNAR